MLLIAEKYIKKITKDHVYLLCVGHFSKDLTSPACFREMWTTCSNVQYLQSLGLHPKPFFVYEQQKYSFLIIRRILSKYFCKDPKCYTVYL